MGSLKMTQDIKTIQSDLANIVQQVNNTMSQVSIQNIINTYKRVRFKSGIYNIDLSSGVGLNVNTGNVIEFENGAILQAIGGNLGNYKILAINNVNNVIIKNPTIIGERDTHIGTTDEWGMGISIQISQNIKITNASCSKCWGDGIYIGDLNENLIFENTICDSNRRQGISLISCKNLTMKNTKLTNTSGTLPSCGLDIEPNPTTVYGLENINIENIYTDNNNNAGIAIYLMYSKNTDKIISINIKNHIDKNSINGMYIGCADKLIGSINIEKPIWKDNKSQALIIEDWSSTSPLVNIINPLIINPHRTTTTALLSSAKTGSAISIYRSSNDTVASSFGNVIIDNPTIINDTVNIFANISIVDTISNRPLENILIRNPIFSGIYQRNMASFVTNDMMKVTDYYQQHILSAAYAMQDGDVVKYFTNQNATTSYLINLASATQIGCKIIIEVKTAQNIQIYPNTHQINGYTTGTQRMNSNTVGSKLIIEKTSATLWDVTYKTGVWTVALP